MTNIFFKHSNIFLAVNLFSEKIKKKLLPFKNIFQHRRKISLEYDFLFLRKASGTFIFNYITMCTEKAMRKLYINENNMMVKLIFGRLS